MEKHMPLCHTKMCILNFIGNFDFTYPTILRSNFTVRWGTFAFAFYNATSRAAIFKNS